MSFYSSDNEGIQSDDEAIIYAKRHIRSQDKYSEGYCEWCGDEWPCTTASLLHIIRRSKDECPGEWVPSEEDLETRDFLDQWGGVS